MGTDNGSERAPGTEQRRAVAEVIGAGAIAGLLAGVVAGLLGMVQSALADFGFWLPMRLVAATYYDALALVGDGGILAVGVLTHLAVSAAWGALFELMAGRDLRTAMAMLAGLAYGATIFLVMTYVLLPWLNVVMFERVTLALRWFFAYHLVFGLLLGVAPWLERRLHGRSEPSPAAA